MNLPNPKHLALTKYGEAVEVEVEKWVNLLLWLLQWVWLDSFS
jgi:hypothetical protein